MSRVDIQHLRTTTDPNRSPANLEPGQISFNLAQPLKSDPCRVTENHLDTYIYIGTGTDSRVDENGQDLSSTTLGSLEANKGWTRYSLDKKFIEGNSTITGDLCVLGDVTIGNTVNISEIGCPLITNCPSAVPGQLLFSIRQAGTPVFDIFDGQINTSNTVSIVTDPSVTGTSFGVTNGVNTLLNIAQNLTAHNVAAFQVNNLGFGEGLLVSSQRVRISNSYTLPDSSPSGAGDYLVSTSTGESAWNANIDGGTY